MKVVASGPEILAGQVAEKARLVLHIDACPDPELAANDRSQMYRYERSGKVAAEREKAKYLILSPTHTVCEGQFSLAVPVSVAFKLRPGRVPGVKRVLRDEDNNMAGACKPWLDAMVDIGLLAGDSPKWVRKVSYEVDVTAGPEYCEITIKAL